MSKVTMTATYTYKGVTYTSGQVYRVRAKDMEALAALNKATKNDARK